MPLQYANLTPFFGGFGLKLVWDAVEDVGDRVTGYRIFRKGPGDSTYRAMPT